MRKILAITSSRADREPLMPVTKALGGNCVHEWGDFSNPSEGDGVTHLLKYHRPEIVLLLGDQYLTLLHATTVANHGVPIAHIHGGELTLGSVDDAFRNAITKLAYWHFPSCQIHADRVNAMNEPWERIFVCGAPGVDALSEPMMTKEECKRGLGIDFVSPMALVCHHPETLGNDSMEWAGELKNYGTVIISGSNSDSGSEEINKFWVNFPHFNHCFRKSYPQKLWLSLMRHADVLIGNSSGFIIEGMTLQEMNRSLRHAFYNKPIINIIGTRQQGRYEEAIEAFLRSDFAFGKPGNVAQKIADILLSVPIPVRPIKYAI